MLPSTFSSTSPPARMESTLRSVGLVIAMLPSAVATRLWPPTCTFTSSRSCKATRSRLVVSSTIMPWVRGPVPLSSVERLATTLVQREVSA
jgi:hypothetical protein